MLDIGVSVILSTLAQASVVGCEVVALKRDTLAALLLFLAQQKVKKVAKKWQKLVFLRGKRKKRLLLFP